MESLLIRLSNGLVKTKQQARWILVGVALVLFVLAVWNIMVNGSSVEQPPEDLINAEQPTEGTIPN